MIRAVRSYPDEQPVLAACLIVDRLGGAWLRMVESKYGSAATSALTAWAVLYRADDLLRAPLAARARAL